MITFERNESETLTGKPEVFRKYLWFFSLNINRKEEV